MSPPGPITLVIQMRCVQMYRQSICKVDPERGQNWAQASETKGTARGHSLQSPKPPRGGAVGRGTLGPRRPAEGSEKSTCLAWTWLGRGAGGRSGAPAAGGGTKPGTVPTPTFIESMDGCCGGGTQPSAPRQAPAPTSGLSRWNTGCQSPGQERATDDARRGLCHLAGADKTCPPRAAAER